MNFLSYAGPCDDGSAPMFFMGTYDIAPTDPNAMSGVMTIMYTTATGQQGPVPGQRLIFDWTKTSGGGLNISSPVFGGLVQEYTMTNAQPIDGSWTWLQNGTVVETNCVGGNFLSFSFNGPNDVTFTAGSYDASDNALSIYYVYGPEVLINATAMGTYVVDRTLSIQLYIPPIHQNVDLKNGQPHHASQMWEGVWKGTTLLDNGKSYCLTTGDFHNNIWRGFQTDCTGDQTFSFGTFIGTFVASSSTISFTYGFVDVDGKGDSIQLEGTTLTYDVSMSMMGTLMQVTLTSSSDGAVMQFVKLP